LNRIDQRKQSATLRDTRGRAGEHDRIYQELIRMQKRLAVLIRDYAELTTPEDERRSGEVILTDPRTGKPF